MENENDNSSGSLDTPPRNTPLIVRYQNNPLGIYFPIDILLKLDVYRIPFTDEIWFETPVILLNNLLHMGHPAPSLLFPLRSSDDSSSVDTGKEVSSEDTDKWVEFRN